MGKGTEKNKEPTETVTMTIDELKLIARESAQQGAEHAVNQTLTNLGFDTSDPVRTQRMMAFVSEAYDTCQTIRKRAIITLVGAAVLGMLGALLTGARFWLKG